MTRCLLRKGSAKSPAGVFIDMERGMKLSMPEYTACLILIRGQTAENGREVIQKRLIFSLLNEAVRAFDERVAGNPGVEAGGQVDLATVMGMGFAPFRGGVFRYAEAIGGSVCLRTADRAF